MADICTDSVSPNNCGHRIVTIGGVTLHLHENDLTPLSSEEKEQFFRYAVRHKGIALAALLNRVLVGDEATNVKQYDIIAAGSAVTKTNIGSTYVDVLPGLNGQRALVDFTGCTQFRVIANVNLVGTGVNTLRLVRDSDSAVLYESATLGAAGERELDSGWLTLPAQASGLSLVRVQAKSTVAADDPVYRRCVVLVQ